MKLPGWNADIPPQGAEIHLEEAPRWVRVWYNLPFLDRLAHAWMWKRGFIRAASEAYATVTNPERFQVLHDFAVELADRLEREYAVERIEGMDVDPDIAESDKMSEARPSIRLQPNDPAGMPIVFTFTTFPGVQFRAGRWDTIMFPYCGCDACAETPEEMLADMPEWIERHITGTLTESLRLPRVGRGYRSSELRDAEGVGLGGQFGPEDRELTLRDLPEPGELHFVWKPWTRRA